MAAILAIFPNMSNPINEKKGKKELPPLSRRHKVEYLTLSEPVHCKHDFVLKGVRNMECRACGFGLLISGPEEFEKIKKLYDGKN